MNEIAARPEPALPSASLPESSSLLAIIARAASDPQVDIAKMQALLDMQERIIAKQAEAEFNQAFTRLVVRLPRIKKDGQVSYPDKQGNPKLAFKFAKLETIDSAIRPLLDEEGFSLSFNSVPRADGGGIIVTGTLRHTSGHTQSASIPLALDASGGKNNLQGMGSTFSYGRRYTTMMLLNVITEDEDDDGKLGGTEFVNAAQVAEIEQLITSGGIPRDPFLEWIGAVRVENIQAADFTTAKNALLKKARKGGSAGQ